MKTFIVAEKSPVDVHVLLPGSGEVFEENSIRKLLEIASCGPEHARNVLRRKDGKSLAIRGVGEEIYCCSKRNLHPREVAVLMPRIVGADAIVNLDVVGIAPLFYTHGHHLG